MTAEIINWTGKMMVAPRSKLADLVKREEAKRAGVYFLVGDDPDNPSKKRVYVGESDTVSQRLKNHQTDESKYFWTHTILAMSKDENLTKSHVLYLEGSLIDLIGSAKRASLANGKGMAIGGLPESDKADMEFFLAQIQLLLPVLGFNFAQPAPTPKAKSSPEGQGSETSEDAPPIFRMSPVGTDARAQEINNEFVVLKGSTARKQGLSSWTSYKPLREQLMQDGELVEDEGQADLLIFTEDVSFSSPSAAAAVVFGGNQNGRLTWKTERNKTYAEWQEEKLEQAIPDLADS